MRNEINAKEREKYNSDVAVRNKIFEQSLKKNYGITLDQRQEISRKQGNRCAICKIHEMEYQERQIKRGGKQTKVLSVDHDHHTGKIRQLLCHNCNLGLGNFQDDLNLLTEAVEYLKKHLA